MKSLLPCHPDRSEAEWRDLLFYRDASGATYFGMCSESRIDVRVWTRPRTVELARSRLYPANGMPFPIKVCVVCSEEFELKPDKPGFANRCPECSAPENDDAGTGSDHMSSNKEVNEARRAAMRDLLYRKDS